MPDPFISHPLLMAPFFSARPWGGARLAGVLGKEVPEAGGPWGESWELSDHPAGRSRIANGPYAGAEFGELVRRFPGGLCGVERAPQRFPLMVKYIDAAEDLSIQVHPDDARAPAGERGKNECWFIMDCAPGGRIVYGLAAGMTPELLGRAADSGALEACLRRVPIRPGDFLEIPAGTVHAILGGTLLCEIQQSSDATLRLWDWGRLPARPLHVAEACAAAECDPVRLAPVRNTTALEPGAWRPLVRNDYFEIYFCALGPHQAVHAELANPHGLALSVVDGAGSMNIAQGSRLEACATNALRSGQTWFIPAGISALTLRSDAAGLRLLASASRELA